MRLLPQDLPLRTFGGRYRACFAKGTAAFHPRPKSLAVEHLPVNRDRVFAQRHDVFAELDNIDAPKTALDLRHIVLWCPQLRRQLPLSQALPLAQIDQDCDQRTVSARAQGGLRHDDALQQMSKAS